MATQKKKTSFSQFEKRKKKPIDVKKAQKAAAKKKKPAAKKKTEKDLKVKGGLPARIRARKINQKKKIEGR